MALLQCSARQAKPETSLKFNRLLAKAGDIQKSPAYSSKIRSHKIMGNFFCKLVILFFCICLGINICVYNFGPTVAVVEAILRSTLFAYCVLLLLSLEKK